MTDMYYKTFTSYGDNVSNMNKVLYSLRDSSAVMNPFVIILFGIFFVLSTSSYYMLTKINGQQRFITSVVAGSFSTFLVAVMFALGGLVAPSAVFLFIGITVLFFMIMIFYKE